MYSILLVDDETAVLDKLSHSIAWEEFGFERVDKAVSGFQALDMLATHPYDILITDIKMPGMDGITLLRNVRRLYSRVRCILLTAFDDFAYVRDALRLGADNYLLKPINNAELASSLTTSLENLTRSQEDTVAALGTIPESETYRHNVLGRWLYGELSGYELSEHAKMADINVFCHYYCTLIVKPLNRSSSFSKSVQKIAKLLQESFDEVYEMMELPNHHIFILGDQDINVETVQKLLFSLFPVNSPPSVFIAIGSVVSQNSDLPVSFKRADRIAQSSMLFAPDQVVVTGAEPATQIPVIDLSPYLSAPSDEDADAMLPALLDDLLQHTGSPLYTGKALISEVLLNVSRYLEKELPATDEIRPFIEESFSNVESSTTQTELRRQLIEILQHARGYLTKKQQNYSPIIKRTLQYIEAHYASPLSLKQISQIFSVNAAYLGYLFKHETQLYFFEYVNLYRIKQAEQLLLSTGQTIAVIASKVGFSDANYFNQCFKKSYGMTPSKYRQLNKQS